MADAKAQLELEIIFDEKGAVKGIKKVNKGVDKTKKATKAAEKQSKSFFTKAKAGYALVGAVIVGVAIKAIKSFVKAAAFQEKQQRTLAAAMKQAGTFTKAAFEENLRYASSLQKMTTFGDEAILGVQKMLTNFGIEGEALKGLTKATLDLAAAKGMDLKAAGDLVAKSVGSSTNALTRYGIEVKGAVGSTERAQMAIENISKLFGGAAAAEAETFSGQVEQLKNVFGDLLEVIGKKLFPILTPIIKVFKNFLSVEDKLTETTDTLTGAITDYEGALEKLETQTGKTTKKQQNFLDANLAFARLKAFEAIEKLEKSYKSITAATDKLAVRAFGLRHTLIQGVTPYEQNKKAIDAYAVSLKKGTRDSETQIKILVDTGDELGRLEEQTLTLLEARKKNNELNREETKIRSEAATKTAAFNQTLDKTIKISNLLGIEVQDLLEDEELINLVFRRQTKILNANTESARKRKAELEKLTEAERKAREADEKRAKLSKDLKTLRKELLAQTITEQDKTKEQIVNIDKVIKGLKLGNKEREKLLELRKKLVKSLKDGNKGGDEELTRLGKLDGKLKEVGETTGLLGGILSKVGDTIGGAFGNVLSTVGEFAQALKGGIAGLVTFAVAQFAKIFTARKEALKSQEELSDSLRDLELANEKTILDAKIAAIEKEKQARLEAFDAETEILLRRVEENSRFNELVEQREAERFAKLSEADKEFELAKRALADETLALEKARAAERKNIEAEALKSRLAFEKRKFDIDKKITIAQLNKDKNEALGSVRGLPSERRKQRGDIRSTYNQLISDVASQEFPGFQQGGTVGGTGGADSQQVNATPGETFINPKQGRNLFNALERAGLLNGGGGSPVNNVDSRNMSTSNKKVFQVNGPITVQANNPAEFGDMLEALGENTGTRILKR